MTSVVLLSIGSILVGFNYLDKVAHLVLLITLPLVNPTYHWFTSKNLSDRIPLSYPKMVRILLFVLSCIMLSPLIILIISWGIIIIVLHIASRIPVFINARLNVYYLKQLNKLQPELYGWLRIAPQLTSLTDSEMSSALEKMRIPFIAIIGLVIFVIGFIWQLTGQIQ